jgi:hypothetical protein
LFKEYWNQHYREFIDNVRDMACIKKVLGLLEVPHFTTLQNSLLRIKSPYLRITLRKTANPFYSSGEGVLITVLDSSGFSKRHCSHYFPERTGKLRKQFLKLSNAVDMDQEAITGVITSTSWVHGTRHAQNLLCLVIPSDHRMVMLWIGDITI